ncbi:unnamed protein product [Calypogeia fissa]
MFWVFDGNHRLTTWLEKANENPNERKYHMRVKWVLIDPKADGFRKIEQAMHGLNEISANVVKTSWLTEADRVRKMLTTPLEQYKSLMSNEVYEAFLKARAHGHGKMWYSKNMTKEAAVYITSWEKIEAGTLAILQRSAEAKKFGFPWSLPQFRKEQAAMMNVATR